MRGQLHGATCTRLVWITILLIQAARVFAQQPFQATAAQDHVLIKFKADLSARFSTLPAADALQVLASQINLPGAELREPAVNQLLRHHGPGQALNPPVDLDRFLYLRLPRGMTVAECVARLQHHPWVEYVEPDGIGTGGTIIPNDPDFPEQWHHQNHEQPSACISTPDAWDITEGSSNVIVAVLDTGLTDATSEFSDRTIPGYNFAYTNSNTADDYGHGTAVTATLGANADNANLVAGVDWHCRLMPLKVLDKNNSGLYSWWAQAVDFAVAHGCKVINLSAGGGSIDATLTRSITNAIARGVIFVTITHNDGAGVIRFPGSLTNCITVGATDEADQRCGFSNYGPQIDLVAPGTNIVTISTIGSLSIWWGTSFSAPLVSGVSALLAAVRPGITQNEVHTLLCAGAEDGVGDATDTPGFDYYYGWGRLNALNSLLLAQTRVDEIQVLTNRTVQLSWRSPGNASNKQPYQVDFRTSLTNSWTPLNPASGFSYQTNRTYWTDDGTLTGTNYGAPAKFFRVRVRPF